MEKAEHEDVNWPMEGLNELTRLRIESQVTEAAITGLVRVLREEKVSWNKIARALDITQQAASSRYHNIEDQPEFRN